MKTCKSCGAEFSRQDSLNRHVNTICSPPESWDECSDCSKNYKDIGKHYQHNPEHRPNISSKQKEIMTGVLLGDGYIKEHERDNPRFAVSMVTEDYIKYLSKKLDNVSKDIYKPPIGENNVQQQFVLTTVTHPELKEFANWYSSGSKVYPEDLTITPTILKNWYVTDGSLQQNRYPVIRCWNEKENTEKVKSYFDQTPLNVSFSSGTIRFPSSKDEFFNYVGKSIPGFSYKWA